MSHALGVILILISVFGCVTVLTAVIAEAVLRDSGKTLFPVRGNRAVHVARARAEAAKHRTEEVREEAQQMAIQAKARILVDAIEQQDADAERRALSEWRGY